MGCGCRDSKSTSGPALTAGAQVFYEVFVNDKYTGRRFHSVLMAQDLADRLGGTVRPSR